MTYKHDKKLIYKIDKGCMLVCIYIRKFVFQLSRVLLILLDISLETNDSDHIDTNFHST